MTVLPPNLTTSVQGLRPTCQKEKTDSQKLLSDLYTHINTHTHTNLNIKINNKDYF